MTFPSSYSAQPKVCIHGKMSLSCATLVAAAYGTTPPPSPFSSRSAASNSSTVAGCSLIPAFSRSLALAITPIEPVFHGSPYCFPSYTPLLSATSV
ncbi:hypothetical protein SGRI78S_03031 [Streptomyces griseus subsp. griseus]